MNKFNCEIIEQALKNGLETPNENDEFCEGYERTDNEIPLSACENCKYFTCNH